MKDVDAQLRDALTLKKGQAEAEKSADRGNVDARDTLGPRSKAGEKQARAHLSLGLRYYGGHGVERDLEEASRWLRKAVKGKGVDEETKAHAQAYLGRCYSESGDHVRAVQMFSAAAEKDIALAQTKLGLCYASGLGVDKDQDKAVHWYISAAAQGDVDAQYYLGSHYINSGDDKLVHAIVFLTRAAKEGSPGALYELGKCYATGRGVDADEKEAKRCFVKSGTAEAKYELGAMATDARVALRLFKDSSEMGCRMADEAIGEIYLHGKGGVEKNLELAYRHFSRSSHAHVVKVATQLLSEDKERASRLMSLAVEQGGIDLLDDEYLGGCMHDRELAGMCCFSCGSVERLRVCKGCREARFCSPACQTRAWRKHATFCSEWRTGGDYEPSS